MYTHFVPTLQHYLDEIPLSYFNANSSCTHYYMAGRKAHCVAQSTPFHVLPPSHFSHSQVSRVVLSSGIGSRPRRNFDAILESHPSSSPLFDRRLKPRPSLGKSSLLTISPESQRWFLSAPSESYVSRFAVPGFPFLELGSVCNGHVTVEEGHRLW